MFVATAMKGGSPDQYGNVKNTFDPNRLSFNVAKTGWWQRVGFNEVVTAAKNSADQLGWRFSKAADGEACSR